MTPRRALSPWDDRYTGRRSEEEEEKSVSFEDSDVVRSAIHLEGFRDDEFDYQLIRALGLADYGGSTVGECLSAAAAIIDGSPRSWAAEFGRLAERVERRGRECLGGRAMPISGRDHLLRASTYYRTAEYYSEGTTAGRGPRGERSERCFADAAALLDPPVQRLEVPFEGGRPAGLPGHRPRPDACLPKAAADVPR